MAQNAKVYCDKRRGLFYVQLYRKGQRYWRGHYDERLTKMDQNAADRIASAINADIDKKGSAFDPRQWFRTPDYVFRFNLNAEQWIERNKPRYAPSARTQVGRYIRMAADFFGESDIRELRKADIIIFLEKGIPAEWASKTKKDVLGFLHKVFADAYDNEMITRIPGWPKVQVVEQEVKWITREWQDRIIAEIPERDRPIFIFMRTWGVRPGEARALRWEDVDFEKSTITIRRTFSGAGCNHLQGYTKTRRVRYLPITEGLLEMLQGIRGIGGYVFRTKHGRPYTADISRIWAEARSVSGCPYQVTLNQGTRHSFATQHLDQLALVSKVLGHTNPQTTKKYEGINLDKIRWLIRDESQANRKQRENGS